MSHSILTRVRPRGVAFFNPPGRTCITSLVSQQLKFKTVRKYGLVPMPKKNLSCFIIFIFLKNLLEHQTQLSDNQKSISTNFGVFDRIWMTTINKRVKIFLTDRNYKRGLAWIPTFNLNVYFWTFLVMTKYNASETFRLSLRRTNSSEPDYG